MIKAKMWKEKDLKGEWEVSYKIDGVRALQSNGKITSRNGKPLYNLDHLDFTDAEIYMGAFDTTITAVRTKKGMPVPEHCVYSLDPLDPRLYVCSLTDPTVKQITDLMTAAIAQGKEGLILRQGKKWLKVKPEETFDVPVIDMETGEGKYTGKLGAFFTPMGKVGTGYTDKQREELLDLPIGTVIEVSCMELTKDGKFRHPRFVRVRWDK